MKAKYIVAVQVVLLACVVVAGALLKNNLADGPRDAHRLLGMLAGITGLVAAVIVTMKGSLQAKLFAWLAFVLSVIAGAAGRSLKGASNYNNTFMTMRGAGIFALLCAVVTLYLLVSTKSTAAPKNDTPEE